MQATQTRARFVSPLISTWMRWRLGLKDRRLMPGTLRPMPPGYFALPRRQIWLPSTGFLPQTAHCIPMMTPAFYRLPGAGRAVVRGLKVKSIAGFRKLTRVPDAEGERLVSGQILGFAGFLSPWQ